MKMVRSVVPLALMFATMAFLLGFKPETANAQSVLDRIKKGVEDAQKKGQPQQQKTPPKQTPPQQTPQTAPAPGQPAPAPQTGGRQPAASNTAAAPENGPASS